MTNQRDSSGGYLTGNESERLWDADEDDAFAADQADEEDNDALSGDEEPIESVWARAFVVAADIRRTEQAIDRLGQQTTFDPEDLPREELERRVMALEAERAELEYEMRERGLPPKSWTPAKVEPPGSAAAPVRPPPPIRRRTPPRNSSPTSDRPRVSAV